MVVVMPSLRARFAKMNALMWLGLTAAMPVHADEVLALRAGCGDCHGVDGQGTGPTYREIAARYQQDAAARSPLIAKVAQGGGGNWAEVTGDLPMPPYSNLLSAEEIASIIDWILLQEGDGG